jgi:hypothetical protein
MKELSSNLIRKRIMLIKLHLMGRIVGMQDKKGKEKEMWILLM